MKKNIIFIGAVAAIALLCILTAGCTTEEEESISPENMTGVIEGNTRFAYDLYGQLSSDGKNAGKNIFFSPYSISTALALTYEGAGGETAEEMRETLYFPADKSVLSGGYKSLIAGINNGDSAYTLRSANALWAEKTYPFLPAYITTAQDCYAAEVRNMDFINAPEESRQTINKWVEDQTEDKIKDLIPQGAIDPLTRLVITNAIYFKGTWVLLFDEEDTYETQFTTGTGEKVTVDMMQRTDDNALYNYTETEDLQILRMPYDHEGAKSLSMLVLLPKENEIGTAEAALGTGALSDALSAMEMQQVRVYFPKFTLECEYSLPDTLSAMGMKTAFAPGADFSEMDGTHDLFISDVVHKAFVEVNEEGTEAAAATAVVMCLSAAPMEEDPVPVFRADHPFVFMIVDDENGNVLFLGRVADPVSG